MTEGIAGAYDGKAGGRKQATAFDRSDRRCAGRSGAAGPERTSR